MVKEVATRDLVTGTVAMDSPEDAVERSDATRCPASGGRRCKTPPKTPTVATRTMAANPVAHQKSRTCTQRQLKEASPKEPKAAVPATEKVGVRPPAIRRDEHATPKVVSGCTEIIEKGKVPPPKVLREPRGRRKDPIDIKAPQGGANRKDPSLIERGPKAARVPKEIVKEIENRQRDPKGKVPDPRVGRTTAVSVSYAVGVLANTGRSLMQSWRSARRTRPP